MKIKPTEIILSFITSSGPGGQNVNKVATAVQLRFNVLASTSLSEEVRARLVTLLGKKMTKEGELLIKANRFRTQERNKQDALARLQNLIERASVAPKKRKKTKPSLASRERRLKVKKKHGMKKALRQDKGDKNSS